MDKNDRNADKMQTGHVYLVGAGPGSRDLITIKGMELLHNCHTVVYDSLSGEELLSEADSSCERIYVGKRAGRHSMSQEEINGILIRKAKEGRTVVRLKGGDPFVFGRGGEEAESLHDAHIPYTLVPGVSSAIAVPELAGIPVTHRGLSRSFHVITAHSKEREPEKIRAYLGNQIAGLKDAEGTLVFLMGLSVLDTICELLLHQGKAPDCPAAVVSGGTRYCETVIRGTLADIGDRVKQEGIVSPAVIVIGETAALSLKTENFLPLHGIRVGMTGTRSLQEKLGRALRRAGAETLCIQELLTERSEGQDKYFVDLSAYTWIVFTSAVGVQLFFDGLSEREIDMRKLSGIKIAVIGSGTADKLRTYGIFADFMPDVYTAEMLAEGLAGCLDKVRDSVLLYQAQEGNPVLERTLRETGINVQRADAYMTKPGTCHCRDELHTLSYLTFASSSGVKAFCMENPYIFTESYMRNVCCAAIGEKTAQALEKAGCINFLTADTYTVEGLVKAVTEDAERRKGE